MCHSSLSGHHLGMTFEKCEKGFQFLSSWPMSDVIVFLSSMPLCLLLFLLPFFSLFSLLSFLLSAKRDHMGASVFIEVVENRCCSQRRRSTLQQHLHITAYYRILQIPLIILQSKQQEYPSAPAYYCMLLYTAVFYGNLYSQRKRRAPPQSPAHAYY